MLDTRDKPFFWEFKNRYERGDEGKVIKGTFTTDYCNRAVIHFKSDKQGYGSHNGNIGTHIGVVSVIAVNQYSQVVHSSSKTMWTLLSGDHQHNAVKDEDVLNMTFSEPVKITFEWSLDLGAYHAHCYGERYWVSVVGSVHMTISCNLTNNGMNGLRIVKKDYEAFFPFRNTYINSKYLTFKHQNIYKYLDITADSRLTSYPNVTIQKNGSVYYIQDRYSSNNSFASGNYHNQAITPSNPRSYTVTIPINGYSRYKIAINGNFDVYGWYDIYHSSYNMGYHSDGNFTSATDSKYAEGHRWNGYTTKQVSEPDGFDMTYPPNTMKGQILLDGLISSVGGSDIQIYTKQMTKLIGDGGCFVNFKVFIKRSGNNLFVTYGWWLSGNDFRCNGNLSYSIKVGVVSYG